MRLGRKIEAARMSLSPLHSLDLFHKILCEDLDVGEIRDKTSMSAPPLWQVLDGSHSVYSFLE